MAFFNVNIQLNFGHWSRWWFFQRFPRFFTVYTIVWREFIDLVLCMNLHLFIFCLLLLDVDVHYTCSVFSVLFGNKNRPAFYVILNLIVLSDFIFKEEEGCSLFSYKLVQASCSECNMRGNFLNLKAWHSLFCGSPLLCFCYFLFDRKENLLQRAEKFQQKIG